MIDRADVVLGAGGLLVAMKGEVARARYPSFFQHAAKLEAEAVELHAYVAHTLKGLLQSEEYARAVFRQWRPLLEEEVVGYEVLPGLLGETEVVEELCEVVGVG